MQIDNQLRVSDSDLDDLRSRLRATRWSKSWPVPEWTAGADAVELHRLVSYWGHAYDWRSHEATINALPSHFAVVDGVDVHYLRYEGEHPGSLPLVITHGWPSSFLELTALAERLSQPSSHGGRAEDAFTVIVPSLPGFALSPPQPALFGTPTHETWHHLMHDVLGFPRYGAHGGDLGAGTSTRLAQAHPEAVIGIHLLAVADPAVYDSATLTGEEKEYLDAALIWAEEEGAYEHQQRTRPLTLAYGLSDSPVGLLAWLVEKYRAWSDNHGLLSSRFSDDFLLTQASLYWFTNSISTSFRPYYEYSHGGTPQLGYVEAPTAVAVFPADLAQPPRSWAERTYNVIRYTVMPRGGHFAAHEEPDLLASDIAEFFRSVR